MYYLLMQAKCSSDPSKTSGFVKVNKILTLIPLLFIILRIWSLVQYFYTISIAKRFPNGCVPPGLKAGYLTLGIIKVKSDFTFCLKKDIYEPINARIITGYIPRPSSPRLYTQ